MPQSAASCPGSSRAVQAMQSLNHLQRRRLKRQLEGVVIHFDYDCFYASVIENENPSLRHLPLAVQQKQIVVTCNYEARRRGLYKLQLIKEAKQICPDVVIVLGEDLTRFRNASKELYAYLKSFSWNSKVERLGFDEVFMDVTDIIEYNVGLLNTNGLANSFFCLSRTDPTAGFAFNAAEVAGQTYPDRSDDATGEALPHDALRLRLHLASHLAKHLRDRLEIEKGYTCTVGISTNKLLSKLVGNLHKPKDQTTLLPPYISETEVLDNVTSFMDRHEVGKIPGIGFKLAQKLRAHILGRPADFDNGLVYGGTKENVLVADVRKCSGMNAETLEQVLGGPGTPHGIGGKIWGLLNGCDDTQVGQAREVPKQISIEDSYIRLDTLVQVNAELRMLAKSLLKRMHADLLEDDEGDDAALGNGVSDPDSACVRTDGAVKRWLAFPKTIRLSTRSRPPQNPDGSRNRSFARTSRSAPMPNFIYTLKEDVDSVSGRLVSETLLPLFGKLHSERSGWNLSLVNIAATNMVDAASDKGGVGRDIAKMFQRQDDVLRQWKVEEASARVDAEPEDIGMIKHTSEQTDSLSVKSRIGSEDVPTISQQQGADQEDFGWESTDEELTEHSTFRCIACDAIMPTFAMTAHSLWHDQKS